MGYEIITKKIESEEDIAYYHIECIMHHPNFPILPIRISMQKFSMVLEIDISNKITFPIQSYISSFSEIDLLSFLISIASTLKICKSYFLDPYMVELSFQTIFYKSHQVKPSISDYYLLYIPLKNRPRKDSLKGLFNEIFLYLNETNKYPIFSSPENQEFFSNWSIENLEVGIEKLKNLLEILAYKSTSEKNKKNKGSGKFFRSAFKSFISKNIHNKKIQTIENTRSDKFEPIADNIHSSNSSNDFVTESEPISQNIYSANFDTKLHTENSTNFNTESSNEYNNFNIDKQENVNVNYNIDLLNFNNINMDDNINKEKSKISSKTIATCIIFEIIFIVIAFIILRNQSYFHNRLTPIIIVSSIVFAFGALDLYFLYNLKSPLSSKSKEKNPERFFENKDEISIFSIKDEQTVLIEKSQKTRIAMLCSGIPGTPTESLGLKAYILVDDFIIGRDGNRVDFKINNLSIGRIHARITKRENSFFIEDLDSRNGTYLDKKKLKKHEEYHLPDNCKIRFAEHEFFFVAN